MHDRSYAYFTALEDVKVADIASCPCFPLFRKLGLHSGAEKHREDRKMASGQATVKMVLSGDTVVLMGRAVNGPPPEIQLSLSSLIAPKLARGPQSAEEVSCCTHRHRFLHMESCCILFSEHASESGTGSASSDA